MKKLLSFILCIILLLTVLLSLPGCASDQDKLEEEWQESINDSYPEWAAWKLIIRFGDKDEVEESSIISFLIEKFKTMNDEDLSEMLWEMEKTAREERYSNIKHLLENPQILEYLQQRYAYSTLSFEEKLKNLYELFDNTSFDFLDYYTLTPTATQEEFNTYIAQYGEIVYTDNSKGGFYANKENSSGGGKVGLDDSPLESYYGDSYYGDFHVSASSGTHLNQWYQEESYSYKNVYFRGFSINFPSYKIQDTDFFFANNLLFYQNDNILNVYVVPDKPSPSVDIPSYGIPQFTVHITE